MADRQTPSPASRKRLPGFRRTQPDPPNGAPEPHGRARTTAGLRVRPSRAAGFDRPRYTQDYGPAAFGPRRTGSRVRRGPADRRPAPARCRRPRRAAGRGLGAIAAVALVAALLGGLIGGYVGFEAARGASPAPSTGVLAQPLPPADPNAHRSRRSRRSPPGCCRASCSCRSRGSAAAGEGSGIVLSADGLLLTNNHVVEAAANGGRVVALFQDGTSAPAQIVGRDPSSDLAVLRAQGVSGLTPVDARQLRLACGSASRWWRSVRRSASAAPSRPGSSARWTGRSASGRSPARARRPCSARCRPTPRSTPATPAARWSTCRAR